MEFMDWLKRWEDNNISFHQDQVEPLLMKYFGTLPVGCVLVPLCGKSSDMIWLLRQGWKVIGIEASPIACKSFFEENGLKYSVQDRDGFSVHSSDRIELWCGDFFRFPESAALSVTAVYDRAALIALPRELRDRYSSHIRTLLGSRAGCKVLLITLEYDQKQIDGPPFSVSEQEIQRLYSDFMKIELLEREEDLPAEGSSHFGKVAQRFEEAHWLTLK